MKNYTRFLAAFSIMSMFILSTQICIAQNTFPSIGSAGIGTTIPNASSILEMVSSSKGMLVPRMMKNQRDAIASPATGLLIYQTNNTPGFYYYSGTAWTAVSAKSKGWALTGNSGTNSGINFVGTADTATLVFRVNSLRSGFLDVRYNSAFGINALYSNITGSHNVAIGNAALKNYIQSFNTAVGDSALANNIDDGRGNASQNTAIGFAALVSNTTGALNTATGSQALYSNITGGLNTATGFRALYSNTDGRSNTANGNNSLYSNTTGIYNTAVGDFALRDNTTGNANTASGAEALRYNTTGFNNTATGNQAASLNTTGTDNTANGYNALYYNQTGSFNTATGDVSLYFNKGDNNTANGNAALYSNSTGYSNVAVGANALYSNTTGNKNTAIGFHADVFSGNLSNAAAIGSNASANCNNCIVLGSVNGVNGGTAKVQVGIGTTNPTSALLQVVLVDNSTITSAIIGKYTYTNNFGIGVGVEGDGSGFGYGVWGVNTSAGAAGYFSGNLTYTGTLSGPSDQKLKENIKTADKMLDKILQLKPSQYNFKKEYSKMNLPQDRQIGFIAQDMEKVFPQLVTNNYDKNVDNGKIFQYKGINYIGLIPVLTKAIQELAVQNDSLKQKNTTLESQVTTLNNKFDDLTKRIKQMENAMSGCSTCLSSSVNNDQIKISTAGGDAEMTALQQNVPNPFNHSTIIGYVLPQKFTAAQIMITDKNGKTLKLVIVSGAGKGKLNIDASTLASGAYNYSLLIDGKIISTKQMVLAK